MGTNVQAFNAELTRWAKQRLPEEVKRVTTAVALEALTRIVGRTPVDTGRARGGWQVAIGSPAAGEGENDQNGTNTVSRGSATIRSAPPFSDVHITNNVEYIDILENGGFDPPDPGPSKDRRPGRKGRILVEGGYSTQAPRGMVDLTFQELRAIFG